MELTTADFKKKKFSVNTKKLSRLFASEPTGYIICDAKKKKYFKSWSTILYSNVCFYMVFKMKALLPIIACQKKWSYGFAKMIFFFSLAWRFSILTCVQIEAKRLVLHNTGCVTFLLLRMELAIHYFANSKGCLRNSLNILLDSWDNG